MKKVLLAGVLATSLLSNVAQAEIISVGDNLNIGVLDLDTDFRTQYYGAYDLERVEGVVMYFARYQDTLALITNIDATEEFSGDNTSGSIVLSMSSDNAFGNMTLKDDPDEGVSDNLGNAWNISWGWADYWRDGMVFEFSTNQASVDVEWKHAVGIDTYHLLSFDQDGTVKAEYLVDNEFTLTIGDTDDLFMSVNTAQASAVPLPAGAGLLALAITGFATRRSIKKA